MNELYEFFSSESGNTLAWIVIFSNIAHAIWLYMMWFFNRKSFDVFSNNLYWISITIASAIMIFIAGFGELVKRSTYNWDGSHMFMGLYFTIMMIVLVILGFIALTEYGSSVRSKLQRKNNG